MRNPLETIMHYSELMAQEENYAFLENLLCEFAKELTGAERCTIWFCDEKSFLLRSSAADGIDDETMPMDKGLVGFSVMDEQAVLCNDAHGDPRFYDVIEKKCGYIVTNTIVVPFKNSNNEVVGALQVLNKTGDDEGFTQEDLRLVKLAVSFTASILNVIYLNFRINTIFEYTTKIADETDTDELLLLLANMGRDIVKADRATLWLSDDSNKTLWTKVAHGVERLEIPNDHGVAGKAYTEDKELIVNEPYNHPLFNKDIDTQTGYTTKSIIAIPLKTADNKKIGVLQCVNKIAKKSEFKSVDMSRMKMVGNYMVAALELERLQYETEEKRLGHQKQKAMIVNELEGEEAYDIYVIYLAADVLSGDSYSIHKTKDGGVFLYLIDAMGHGLLPALTSFSFSSFVKQAVLQVDNMQEMMDKLSLAFEAILGDCEQLSGAFFWFDADFKEVTYSMAGMYPALILDGCTIVELSSNNIPAMNFCSELKCETLKLQEFKKLVVFSDGLLEGRLIGQQEQKDLTQKEFLESVHSRAQNSQLEDDLTVVYFEKL